MMPSGSRSALAAVAALLAAACGGSYSSGAAAAGPPPVGPPLAVPADPPRALSFDVRGSPAEGGGLLNVVGSNLAVTTAVTFGGVRALVTDFTIGALGTGVLTVVVPPASLPAGVTDAFVDVMVSNPDGQSSTLAPPSSRDGTPWPANFHYGPAPTVTGFTPTSGDGVAVTVTGTGFSSETSGPRAGMRVVLSGPSVVSLQLPRCPDASEPACPGGVVSPTASSVLAAVPSGQLRPGAYTLTVMNFDGQAAQAAGTFVVP